MMEEFLSSRPLAQFALRVRLPKAPPLDKARSAFGAVNGANLAAGLTAGFWYAFGALPLYLNAAASLGLSAAATSSWCFIIFFTSATASTLLTLRYRQPLAIGWSIPGLVLVMTVGSRYTLQEIAGAGLVTGVIVLVLGLTGVSERLVRWLPLPIVMGVFAGGILGLVSAVFTHLEAQPWTVGAALAGYLGARALGRTWLPPVGGAVVAGIVTAMLTDQLHLAEVRWSPPMVEAVWPALNVASMLALSVPLVLVTIGIGSVQGVSFLESQGYRPPTRLLTVALGVTSVINAYFGGHPTTIQRNGVAILAGPDAGPRDQRFVACLVASVCALLLALGAGMAGTLLGALPPGLVASLAGLALLSALMDAFRKVVVTDLPAGAFLALAVAAAPLTILGVGSAFWALVMGLLTSLLLERQALMRAWELPTRP